MIFIDLQKYYDGYIEKKHIESDQLKKFDIENEDDNRFIMTEHLSKYIIWSWINPKKICEK